MMEQYIEIIKHTLQTVSINHWERHIKKNHPEVWKWIYDHCRDYSPANFSESIYIILNSPPKRCENNQLPKFESYHKGYQKFCKHGCACFKQHLKKQQQQITNEERTRRRQKYKETMIERHGVDNPLHNAQIKEKIKQTNLEKYGVDNPSKAQVIKDKIKDTMQERYGVDAPMQSPEFIENYKQSMIDTHGVSFPKQSPEICNKISKTLIEKYGVDATWKSEEIQQKAKQTMLEKYGTENAWHVPEFIEKAKQTMLERYGAEYAAQVPEIVEKIKETNIEKYGAAYTFQTDAFKLKSKQTMLEKYGVPAGNSVHLTADQYQKMIDPEWLQTACETMSIYEIAQVLNCDVTTVYNRTKQFGIRESLGTAKSHAEQVIADYIRSLGFDDVIQNDRTIIKPKELDIVIPSANIAIEFCGIHWHSEKYRGKNSHKDKLLEAAKAGFQLITIFEDEWMTRPNVIRSAIRHKLGKSTDKIYARKTRTELVNDIELIKNFYDLNHIQGWDKGSTVTYGLFVENIPVAMMSFEKYKQNQVYLTRYATSITVVGGASKLLNCYIKNHPTITEIISFSDLRWTDGHMYEKLGFKPIQILNPDYQYIIKGVRHHKFGFRKKNLEKLFGHFLDVNNLTEQQIMSKMDIPRIWDCGKIKWEFKISNNK